MPEMAWVWLAALVIFAIVEASTVTLVSIWFVGGSLAALIAALCGGELWLQVVLFLAVSILLLLSLRPLLRKFYSPKKIQTNAPANIGKLAIVTEDIDNLRSTGAVKLSGVVWDKLSYASLIVCAAAAVLYYITKKVKASHAAGNP